VVTVTASGGARMQEGMAALVQMAKVAEARRRHAAAGLAHVSVLTSPTTGGVYASFASLADVILAEPESTVGFAGPRVVAELTGNAPDARVHTAEFAFAHGLVDALVEEGAQATQIGLVLKATMRGGFGGRSAPQQSGARSAPDQPGARGSAQHATAWERVQLVRDPQRPKARQVIEALLPNSFEIRGDRTGAPDDPNVVVRVSGAVAIGQDSSGDGRIKPEGFRKAVRAIELAGRLGLPVVTLIDTRGADPLPESEAAGVAGAIARTFVAMLGCPSPTLAVLIGEGGSGGALSMAPADRVLAWENAVFSVIAPEGAATILYRDASRAPELAERLRITTSDLEEMGIVDAIVAEPAEIERLSGAIDGHLSELTAMRSRSRLRRRHERWRKLTDRYLQQA
jgi:acetyl-CoA carboxylase carboxyl transferase subunit beta